MRVSVCGRWRALGVALSALALLSTACGTTRRNGGSFSTGAVGGSGGSSAGTGGVAGGAAMAALEAVPSEMHRLNQAEYEATVADVLGSTAPLPLFRGGEIDGFDNIAAVLGLDESAFEAFLSAAETVAHEVMTNDSLKARVVTCQAGAGCARTIIDETGLRVFRRPLLEQEASIYAKVYADALAQGEAHESAIERVLTALLASAQFLYRMEFERETPGTRALDGYELASRLSYLMWSSAPDDELLAQAEADALQEDEEVDAQLTRLWADARSERFTRNFAGQWLGARSLTRHAASPELFPDWTPQVALAAEREVYDYFELFLREDQSWPGFLQGRPHTVSGVLAPFYGLAAPATADAPLLVDLPERNGYLGSVAFLTTTSLDRRTTPTHRGSVILSRLLCSPPPSEPPGLSFPDLPQELPTNPRAALELYRAAPVCSACHALFEPLGIALEHYDAVGKYRASYEDGSAVDASTMLPENDGPFSRTSVDGLRGVVDWASTDPRFVTCTAKKLYTYGMGRLLKPVDERNVEKLTANWQGGPLTIKQLVRGLVLSTPFRTRAGGEEL